jgi:hypothetical protein
LIGAVFGLRVRVTRATTRTTRPRRGTVGIGVRRAARAGGGEGNETEDRGSLLQGSRIRAGSSFDLSKCFAVLRRPYAHIDAR